MIQDKFDGPNFDLSIVIPALNEEKRIGATIDSLAIFLSKDVMKGTRTEVIVAMADSDDDTYRVAKRRGKKIRNFRLIQTGPKVGKGRDVRLGLLEARGKKIMYMDADLATPLYYIPQFLALSQDYDIVTGVRNLKKHHSYAPRRWLSIAGNLLYKVLGGVWIEDSQCGFKLFSAEAAKTCFSKQTIMQWGFDMEVLTIAKVNHYSSVHVRINDWRDVPGGTFNASSTLRNALSGLHDLIRIWINRIKGIYRV